MTKDKSFFLKQKKAKVNPLASCHQSSDIYSTTNFLILPLMLIT